MNKSEIKQFIAAFKDFMKHAETEVNEHQKRQEAKNYAMNLYEQKAAELEVTVDYYMMEFI